MEIAYTSTSTATPLGEILGREVEETRKKEAQTQSASIGDTVAISAEAREKQRAQAAGESGDKAQDNGSASEFGGNSALGKGVASGGMAQAAAGENDTESEVEKIQREIRDLQTQITDANNRLAAAQSRGQSEQTQAAAPAQGAAAAQTAEGEDAQGADLGSATPPMPGAAIAKGDEEVKSIQTELTQLSNQLMRLYEKLQEAMKSEGGTSAGGGSSGGAAGVSIGGGTIG